ncbi:MAG: hypothetical protein LBB88_03205 [Planctomycetaceae bacterium]|nr:hypothetical protein [Planctomycetaceae bacterium]
MSIAFYFVENKVALMKVTLMALINIIVGYRRRDLSAKGCEPTVAYLSRRSPT